jgi:hypothetical protein
MQFTAVNCTTRRGGAQVARRGRVRVERCAKCGLTCCNSYFAMQFTAVNCIATTAVGRRHCLA